ncbi:hypothetical protein [Oerskovia paurometabola]|uniref:Transporter n=1 Tax=Oerskovia paurometabola TaxID=162170 RepID=A0ABW1XBA6_9CELL|nr:hypothetical protein [Oerskovia paurometabola]MBM7499043.1 hypothetical protein [Oerskovia paurometabola]
MPDQMPDQTSDRPAGPAQGPDDDQPLDPAASLRLIAAQQEKAKDVEPDGRVLYGVWGLAWLLGYTTLYVSSLRSAAPPATATLQIGASDVVGQPEPWALLAFTFLIVGAVAITIVHIMTRVSGVRGASARSGALYGWAWFISFAAMSMVLGGLARAGASPEVMSLASNSLSCLVVGIMYLAGGAMWQEVRLYVLGVWILLVAGAATIVGLPGLYLVMAAAGGGGFLLMALVEQVLRVRTRRRIAGGARA